MAQQLQYIWDGWINGSASNCYSNGPRFESFEPVENRLKKNNQGHCVLCNTAKRVELCPEEDIKILTKTNHIIDKRFGIFLLKQQQQQKKFLKYKFFFFFRLQQWTVYWFHYFPTLFQNDALSMENLFTDRTLRLKCASCSITVTAFFSCRIMHCIAVYLKWKFTKTIEEG